MMCIFMIHLIFINKVEVISVTNDITFCCFANNIFFIKYIAIMFMLTVLTFILIFVSVMMVVFTFVIVMFAIVFMVLRTYYRISLFIFINIMEMISMSNDIPCFCFTYDIFFIKDIAIFNFFMMFMRY